MNNKDRDHFIKHMEWASKVVESWPEWKQGLLGGKTMNDKETVKDFQKHIRESKFDPSKYKEYELQHLRNYMITMDRPETKRLDKFINQEDDKPQSGHPMSWKEIEPLKELKALKEYCNELEARLYRIKRVVSEQ